MSFPRVSEGLRTPQHPQKRHSLQLPTLGYFYLNFLHSQDIQGLHHQFSGTSSVLRAKWYQSACASPNHAHCLPHLRSVQVCVKCPSSPFNSYSSHRILLRIISSRNLPWPCCVRNACVCFTARITGWWWNHVFTCLSHPLGSRASTTEARMSRLSFNQQHLVCCFLHSRFPTKMGWTVVLQLEKCCLLNNSYEVFGVYPLNQFMFCPNFREKTKVTKQKKKARIKASGVACGDECLGPGSWITQTDFRKKIANDMSSMKEPLSIEITLLGWKIKGNKCANHLP